MNRNLRPNCGDRNEWRLVPYQLDRKSQWQEPGVALAPNETKQDPLYTHFPLCSPRLFAGRITLEESLLQPRQQSVKLETLK